jgi:hypothetical protein
VIMSDRGIESFFGWVTGCRSQTTSVRAMTQTEKEVVAGRTKVG